MSSLVALPAVPETLGVESLVVDPPAGDVTVGEGAVVSIVTLSAALDDEVLFAPSVAVAVMECEPSLSVETPML